MSEIPKKKITRVRNFPQADIAKHAHIGTHFIPRGTLLFTLIKKSSAFVFYCKI